MKSLILVAVILQLVIIGIKTDGKYQFGDIIEFPRGCIDGTPTFSHFAVYVGPESGVNVSQGDNDIFHRTAQRKEIFTCEFGKLDETRGNSIDEKKNYLDEEIPAGNRTTDKIKERIEEVKGDCGNYELSTNNCEHFVSYVRYGRRFSVQNGTVAECVFETNNANEEEIKKKYEAVRNRTVDRNQETDENNNALCSNDARKQVSWWPVLSACLLLSPHWFM